ncbi:hypothetical protein [Methanomethylophilus alvi]|uniref:hypothetical protein n=1 Tax=Methanomethylophilus alvi TaxID=1291540 RepID=UPI0037DC3E07
MDSKKHIQVSNTLDKEGIERNRSYADGRIVITKTVEGLDDPLEITITIGLNSESFSVTLPTEFDKQCYASVQGLLNDINRQASKYGNGCTVYLDHENGNVGISSIYIDNGSLDEEVLSWYIASIVDHASEIGKELTKTDSDSDIYLCRRTDEVSTMYR